MSIFISTGELSGDIYAAKLSESLGRILPGEKMWGMCGELADGVEQEWNNSLLHIVGFANILSSLPKFFKLRDEMAEQVIIRRPRAVIVVDSPDFHLPLIKKIRSLGYEGPVIYVCPPTVWAWRSGRVKKLRKYCNLCLPLFKFEEDALLKGGADSYWCGHPLIDDFAEFKLSPELPYNEQRVALLPGSRKNEIKTLMPVLEESALLLRERGLEPVFSVAPGLNAACRERVENNKYNIPVSHLSGRELMAASRFVIGASGTTAVEAMLLERYMIVLYRGTALEWTVYKLLSHTPFVSIPNVLAGHMVYPELLQDDCTVGNVIRYADRYCEDGSYAQAVDHQILENKRLMGRPGAVDRWAASIAGLING